MWACNLCNLCEPVICISASAVNLSRSRLLRFSADQLFLAKRRAKWICVGVPRGLMVRLWPGAAKGPSSNLASTFSSSLLFFSFSFHFRYNSFVMFLYIAHNFWLTNFLLGFTCLFPKSFARSWDLRIFSKLLIDRRLKLIFFRLFLKSHMVLF